MASADEQGVSMKRSWTASAVAFGFVAALAVAGCNDYGNTFLYSTPSLISVSPSDVNAGGPDLTIIINADFTQLSPQTYITWNQKKISTKVTTDPTSNTVTGITAVVPAADTAKPGTYFVQAVDPTNPNGTGFTGVSNAIAFFVNPVPNPVPTISSIAPNSAAAGSASVPLTITGTNFLLTTDPSGGSQVRWNTTTQTNLAVTNITATQIQATVPSNLIANAGSATVTVYNPPVPPPPGCTPGVNCGGNGGGGVSLCPLVAGSTTVTVCTFTITSSGPTNTSGSSAQLQEETPAVSKDGRYVSYTALQNGHTQIFERDSCLGADSSCQPRTVLVSSAQDGTAATDDSHSPSMSSDGRYVAFSSAAPNLVAETTTGRQVYLRDTCFGASGSCTPSTQLISTDPNGNLVGTEGILPSVSASGRFVAFLAVTPSLSTSSSGTTAPASKSPAPSDNSGYRQVFVRDTCLGAANCTPTTTRITLQPGDGSGASDKPAGPAISGKANQVALASGNTATVFTRSVAIDDGVFLALTKSQ
jgi:hypothetical protein